MTTFQQPPYPEADPVRVRFTVRTHSGSEYRLGEHATAGWVYSASNKPTDHSHRVPAGWWPIEMPADPVEGEPMIIRRRPSPGAETPDDHACVGKTTSVVTGVTRHRPARPTLDFLYPLPLTLEP